MRADFDYPEEDNVTALSLGETVIMAAVIFLLRLHTSHRRRLKGPLLPWLS